MADARFMFVQLPLRPEVDIDQISPVLDKAVDWVQISPNSWLLWTTSTAERWNTRISSKFGQNTRRFICAIDPSQRHGRMPKAFWEFLDKER